MALLHRAGWVLPIAGPPIRDGWVLVDGGKIRNFGRGEAPQGARRAPSPLTQERGSAVIVPGLVNAHAHLELSWMRHKVGPAATMPEWVESVMALQRRVRDDSSQPIAAAVLEMRESGTALVGDVTNTLASREPLADSPLSAMLFYELLGFNAPDPRRLVADAEWRLANLTPVERLRASVVPHAPYSVSFELFRAIAESSSDRPVSVHVSESPEELEFLNSGGGAWQRLLRTFGAWRDDWVPPACGAVELLARAGLLNERLIAVHCVQLTDAELEQLAAARATVVTCPRSNRWTGAGSPPVAKFFKSGVRVAIGTDSLASVDDLNIFTEMAAVRALAPEVPAGTILRSATLAGAEALGFGGELGSIEAGKRAELISVNAPAGFADVEEYLVSGRVSPADIRWLDPD